MRIVQVLLWGCLTAFALTTGTQAAEAAFDLQAAVDKAQQGDTIVLLPGIYAGPVVIGKTLTLRAERDGEAVLLNESGDSALRIEADGVAVAGLHILDEAFKERPTVLVTGDRVTLDALRIRTGADGIVARDASDGSVTSSVIEWGPDDMRMANKGNGIDLFNAHRWHISDNVIRDVHDGIYMESSDNAVVSGNVIERSRYGVHCMYTSGTVISGNTGNRNVTGAMVMTASKVKVTDNVFAMQSENVHSQGILLYDAHDSLFADNAVEGNRVGLYVEQSTGNRLEGNYAAYNFIGIQLIDASKNSMTGNWFQGNVADAQARGSRDNEISGNYWDSFRGIDADGDGRSDLTYAINPFFQELTQKRPAFQLFFQSPGMAFLEGVYQADRARWATDIAPLMAPPGGAAADGRKESPIATGAVSLGLLVCSCALIYTMRRRLG